MEKKIFKIDYCESERKVIIDTMKTNSTLCIDIGFYKIFLPFFFKKKINKNEKKVLEFHMEILRGTNNC